MGCLQGDNPQGDNFLHWARQFRLDVSCSTRIWNQAFQHSRYKRIADNDVKEKLKKKTNRLALGQFFNYSFSAWLIGTRVKTTIFGKCPIFFFPRIFQKYDSRAYEIVTALWEKMNGY